MSLSAFWKKAITAIAGIIFLIIAVRYGVPAIFEMRYYANIRHRNPYIPKSATKIHIWSDKIWDFHGDGTLFITFICSEEDIIKLIDRFDRFIKNKKIGMLDQKAVNTISGLNANVAKEYLPDTKKPYYYYCFGESQWGLNSIYYQLYIINSEEKKFWLFEYSN